jgi:4-hydroxybenzoate polyprenyltransferase
MHFIKLIRPLNLIIIAISMYGIAWYFEGVFTIESTLGIKSFLFFLLVLSTVMIAAAGNIINDYFDIKADLINKPDRVIIGKFVKRRVAILSHWMTNFLAFSIAVYLSWRLQTYWYLFIHLLTINLLWYYSLRLKREFFIGNFLIAGLTALVPLLVGYYYFHIRDINEFPTLENNFYPFAQSAIANYTLLLTFAISGFAFVMNLAREIIKDMEDMEGDKKLRAKTLPIVLGITKTKWVSGIVLSATILISASIWAVYSTIPLISMIPVFLCALLILVCFILLVISSTKSQFRAINHLIKLAMIFGMLTPVYWRIIMIYG